MNASALRDKTRARSVRCPTSPLRRQGGGPTSASPKRIRQLSPRACGHPDSIPAHLGDSGARAADNRCKLIAEIRDIPTNDNGFRPAGCRDAVADAVTKSPVRMNPGRMSTASACRQCRRIIRNEVVPSSHCSAAHTRNNSFPAGSPRVLPALGSPHPLIFF